MPPSPMLGAPCPWAAHTAQLHCTSGMGTQMGHPACHRKGQTHAPCFGLGSLSPQLFIFTHCTTIPVFTRLYLLYCVSWSCMCPRCPRPRRGRSVQPEPKCQRLKNALINHTFVQTPPHPCCPGLLPGWHRVPMGLMVGGQWPCPAQGTRGAGQALVPHPRLRPAKSFS